MGFAADIGKFTQKARRNADDAVANVVANMGAALVSRSPIGDITLWDGAPAADYRPGTFANNWVASIGGADASAGRGPNVTGAESLASITAAARRASGNVVFVTNSLPYARRLEYGWSSQAPGGFARIVAAEFDQFVRASVRGLDV